MISNRNTKPSTQVHPFLAAGFLNGFNGLNAPSINNTNPIMDTRRRSYRNPSQNTRQLEEEDEPGMENIIQVNNLAILMVSSKNNRTNKIHRISGDNRNMCANFAIICTYRFYSC